MKIVGLAIILFGVFLEVLWLGFCFQSVIIGILLLIFAPAILFFPFSFFLVLALDTIYGKTKSKSYQFKYKNYSYKKTYTPSKYTFELYYETLESNPTDSLYTIKSNYRRLIKQYHYDSIASKNLPEEMVRFSEEKTQSLNEAYAAIKKVKKI